jgi:hypothetical protein
MKDCEIFDGKDAHLKFNSAQPQSTDDMFGKLRVVDLILIQLYVDFIRHQNFTNLPASGQS